MPSCIEKRLNKEIDDFEKQRYYQLFYKSPNIINFFDSLKLNLYILDTNDDIEYPLKLIVSQHLKNQVVLELDVPKYYPFKPFSISLYNLKKSTNITYHKYINNLNNPKQKIYDPEILKFFFTIQYQIKPKFLNLESQKCFCCQSLTCSHNWNPSLRINHLLLEYLEMRFICQYNQPYSYLLLTTLYQQLFDLYFRKLPTEIMDKILSIIYYSEPKDKNY